MTTEHLSQIQRMVEQLLSLMEVEAQVTVETDQSLVLTVAMDGEDLGVLIGYHGETLAALQSIISLMVNHDIEEGGPVERFKVLVNVGDYRERQRESLEALARRSAERVRFSKKSLTLPPMSSYDRRIVHMALEHEVDIISESEGEGRERRLLVKPRDN
jgi:spoIIIJ-associated protein